MTGRSTAFQAIGTKWDIQIQDAMDDDAWAKLIKQLHERIKTFDKTYSRFRSDSLVATIAKKPGSYKVPPDSYKLLDLYHQLYEATGGRVTPLIGQTMVEAGYDVTYSLQKKTLHRPPVWEEVMTYTRDGITTKQPILLDFGAAGKGYLVDILGGIIEQAGLRTYMINAGGDIRYRSSQGKELEVGLENPANTSEAIGIVRLTSGSICASAGSKRKWIGLNHIIDPTTLRSPTEIIATWVMAGDTMTADGLATALFFTEPAQLLKQFSFSYALLREDMGFEATRQFPITLFEAA